MGKFPGETSRLCKDFRELASAKWADHATPTTEVILLAFSILDNSDLGILIRLKLNLGGRYGLTAHSVDMWRP